ncbi:ArnT family glycosyltransferase [Hymenobacter rigui]|uniref:Phospholipid carrier-dependent glycosyltransferase n=1 Tax=Hymenobacter rigui TaxID=334424 RepID=A0A3R9MTD1_9BACT|nr:glycosyltransferase family 39 protein [Hymenobacter rigui]RSK49601.1 phospholipid carrier-dependent glycosyltransferase [Hymenobacter rigui]
MHATSPLSAVPPVWQRVLPLTLLLALAYFPLFWQLGSFPVQQWDESRTALDALGMLVHHDWIVARYDGQPDLWNCKPPLWLWTLAGSIRGLGPSEVGLRLPAALSALATVGLVYLAAARWLRSRLAGLLAGLVLLTAPGYVSFHVARTADFDAFLTLWTTLGAFSWVAFLRSGRARWAWLTGGAFGLAILTKGIAGAMFGPGLLLAAWSTGSLHRLRRPAPWLAAGLALALAGCWYLVREAAAPGYLEAVWQYEVGGPAAHELEGNDGPFEFYLSLLANWQFALWLLSALLGVALGWWQPRGSAGWWLGRTLGVVSGSFLLVISLAQTKLVWYDAPVFPLLALLATSGIVAALRLLRQATNKPLTYGTQVAGVLMLAAFPYLNQVQYLRQLSKYRFDNHQLVYGHHLRQQWQQHPELWTYTLGTDGSFNDAPLYYQLAAHYQQGHTVTRLAAWQAAESRPGDVVAVCGQKATRAWQAAFQTEILVQSDSCRTLRLGARR